MRRTTSTRKDLDPRDRARPANTHRALKHDEVKETTQLLEEALTSDNLDAGMEMGEGQQGTAGY